MNRKRVLLALKQNLNGIRNSVIEYSSKAGWILELFPYAIPRGWYGDGVIVDSFSWNELKNIENVKTIPIVSCRMILQRKNVRIVMGNTRSIAKIVADRFISQGFKNFASFTTHPPINDKPEIVASIMPDLALKYELETRGFTLKMICLRPSPDEKDNNFKKQVKLLGRFLKELPKPCACFTTNTNNTFIFYRACEENNIKVPQEIAFLANNDAPEITEHTYPTTSALTGEIGNVGFSLAKILDDMMSGKETPRAPRIMEPSGIIARQSTDILATPNLQTAKAINFILTNYMKQINIQDAAEHAELHPDMMNYLFKKHINKTPGCLLREVRMAKAKEMLINSKMSLSKIASLIGYGSAMSFSLAFKKETGITPGNYRQRMP